ncbi:bifunctional RNase H/acid phosphatase [Nocardia asteroides]|uniref:Ribonuclease H/acid phosphatase n=1 Tax=Nocardia asteroides NBRC 15531 TaxID=1110697 RepID=U5EQQ3_NOCAS|nr:bifunctional RNase H/acid phosphatase [Nocardia asteroides]TLF63671.1 bifunctional RNase H/acid phosphatase [Nocardia asteroides NBRC 15531]UGT46868.1 bifunctional RNase H/acid phosphatase [Nocardia asteroides]SFM86133.1 probable phosphoglycerate mutase [Nocardia asteroides]VEG34277.1 bifunctional RNase H/acid phosphatase [Nocardia asteroides]GAD87439.1 putative ribonuclease H/acid phosphatase [Nocardia asteroides NBRC 15531]
MTEVIVEADGGSRGNPGPAGYGAVVFDADHARVLAERKEFVGVATNNVAEYRGLIAGLAAAAELGARVVAVRMDSKLVVEQMSGRWKVKHPSMIPLAEQARALAAGFDRVSFTWIPRAQNSHADRLANEAMDDGDTVATVRTAVAAGHAPGDQVAVPAAPEPTAAQKVSVAPGWTGAVGRPTRLLLLRHGQTELSVQRRYSGRGNPPLTELGREQADRAAKMLAAKGDIAAVVTSPLQRARATAEAAAAALDVPLRVLDGLIETDFGDWEGLTFAEAVQRDPQLHADWLGDPSIPAPGGESFDQVRERIEGVRRDLVALYPGENVVVVSHVTPIKTLVQLALGVGPSLLYRLHLDLASLCVAEFYPDGGSSVRLVNDTSYL